MPRDGTTGVFTRVSNSFSNPSTGQVISPTDADTTFDDFDSGISGSVATPVSSTDNAVMRFDGTTGKKSQNSVVTIDDTGVVAGASISGSSNTLTNVSGTSIRMGSDARGDVLYFNGTNYARLPAGTSGNFLKTQGAGADPIWAVPGAGGDLLSTNNLSDVASVVTSVSHLGLRTQLTTPTTVYVGTTPATVTISNASPGVVTWTTHGRSANDPVAFATSGSLPTGLTAGTVYYVKTVLTGDTFTVSATPGGAAINTSSAGSGTHKSWTGNDSTGDGTSARPYMTLQVAWDKTLDLYDCRGDFLTIQVRAAHQKVTGNVLDAYGQIPGQSNLSHITILGDTATPGNCLLEGTTDTLRIEQYANLTVSGFKIISSGGGISVTQSATVSYDHCDFGVCGTQHILTSKYASSYDGGNNTISGAAPVHNYVTDTGSAFETTGTTTITGTPAFSTAYVVADVGGKFVDHTKTYSGSATGKRAVVDHVSMISVETLTKLPGDAAIQVNDVQSIVYTEDSADTSSVYADWTSFSPTVTSVGGTITTVGSATMYYRKVGNIVHYRISNITITTVGSASGAMLVTLPFNSVGSGAGHFSGFNANTKKGVSGVVHYDAANKISIVTSADGSFPAGSGEIIYGGGSYESA